MYDLESSLNRLEEKIKQPNFRQNKGLGNEVGYYVFDYPAEQELFVRERIKYLKDKYGNSNLDFKIIVFDLYDIIIDLLLKEGFLNLCDELEKNKGLSEIIIAINEMLRMEEDNQNNEILAHIKNNIEDNSIVFLTGVGKCFPFLRSHKVLNNLHQYIDNVPVVMFFPGEYDGQSLVLFSEIKDDNYYRAFKIVE
ncbi:DUF1788 domain-containing protein [Turicibacter bilis]|uniref:DUF1788 domain-containing protein n=1 Tax=Turicibacter bilis TaxID=2735723 RepID=A0A9Q9FIR9_9FIRM|nr:DUF1788 domain-containing protein [Turicibacter bilis]MBS3198946.1 DUF1788 domain-containing protein [Turicibacter bilis]UUF08489.1 DUF1788 domain-containing protein [Turicibacter bilis]